MNGTNTAKSWLRHLRLRWMAWVATALAGFVVGVVALALMNAQVLYDDLDTCDGTALPDVDAVVVLAGGRGRIAAAGDIWYRYWEDARSSDKGRRVPVFYVSGMGPKSRWSTLESQVRRGVAPLLQQETVVLETESSDTVENALWLVRHARKHAWRSVLLMTSSYHMARSRYIFERVMEQEHYPIAIETLSVFQDPFSRQEWTSDFNGIRITLTEYFKLLYFKTFW